MQMDRLSDLENLIKKGAHVIVSLYYDNGSKKLYLASPYKEISIHDLKSLVQTAISFKTTITIRYADCLDLRDLEELVSIGGGNVVLDFSTYRKH